MSRRSLQIKKTITVATEIFVAISLCVLMVMLSLGDTVMSSSYIQKEMEDHQVYKEIAAIVKSKTKESYLKSDYRVDLIDDDIDTLLNNSIKPELIQKEMEKQIDNYCNGNRTPLTADGIKQDVSAVLLPLLRDSDIMFYPEEVDRLITTIAKITAENIDLHEATGWIPSALNSSADIVLLTALCCFVFAMLLLVLLYIISRERPRKIGLPFLVASGLILLIAVIGRVIEELTPTLLANDTLNQFIQTIIYEMLFELVAAALITALMGVVLFASADYARKRQEEKRRIAEEKQNPSVLLLLNRRRKGFLRLVFSRIGLTAVLIILQLILLHSAYVLFEESIRWFAGVIVIFRLIMFLYLFRTDMDATAKLTWLLMMFLFPIPACILLWIAQRNIGHGFVRKRLTFLNEQTKNIIPQKQEILEQADIQTSGTGSLCRYLNLSGTFPLYSNTSVTFFPLGEKKYKAMLEELKKAEKFIFMEYFIIDEGMMWGSILKILADKAAQGVDVRIMYDGMCEISTLSGDYPARLKKLGIRCKAFSPIRPFISTSYNYRDHRKILVIDGKVAFNGGVNLADEYINHIERFGHWKDTALMLKGEAVQSFTLMFLQMWHLTELKTEWSPFVDICEPAPADGFVLPYSDSPLDRYKAGENVYMDILNRAKRYVHIMTPYLILDNELEESLKFAAQRGVDVRLILPGIPDKKSAYSLAKSHYKYLIEAGVKLYEYTPGFVHAKVFVSDDEKAVVGTINLDYRSLYHHFECATYLYQVSCISDIEEDFQATLAQCREVTPEKIRHEKLSYRIRGAVMKLIAPLL